MSKLGELIDYTGEECPNCGRVRVELWTCGKRICEKCHWCIEDQAYYREELEEDEPSLYGTVAKVHVNGSGRTFVDAMKEILVAREEGRKWLESELDPYRLRAESLGLDIHMAYHHAQCMGISLDRYLDFVAALTDTFSKGAFTDVMELPDEQPEWTDAQIRKQLKYEKNPMRVKELNKMLSGRKKKRK